MKSIFTYTDYRIYLKDFYEEQKRNGKFSYREFSKLAGFSSPVFIKLVIEGKSNLTKNSIKQVVKAVKLVKDERKYFESLVYFSQVETIDEKIDILNQMRKIKGSLKVTALSNDQHEFYDKWYHPVMRELLSIISFDGDFEKLGKMINPPITAKEAEESYNLLLKLKLIRRGAENQLVSTVNFISSKELTMGTLVIKKHQQKMINLGAEAIEKIEKTERDISGITISCSSDSLEKISSELQKCRENIMAIASNDSTSNIIYRINLQCFPLCNTLHADDMRRGEADS